MRLESPEGDPLEVAPFPPMLLLLLLPTMPLMMLLRLPAMLRLPPRALSHQ